MGSPRITWNRALIDALTPFPEESEMHLSLMSNGTFTLQQNMYRGYSFYSVKFEGFFYIYSIFSQIVK